MYCWEVFENGVCDEQCNTQECLYDGFDCRKKVKNCNPIYDAYCSNHYANGLCDKGCDTAECDWDGLDCDDSPEMLAKGTLIVIILVEPSVFRNISVTFVRRLGHLLRTVVRVKKDANGNEMIYPWTDSGQTDVATIRVKRYLEEIITGRVKRAALTGQVTIFLFII